jgi:hypothetical protein
MTNSERVTIHVALDNQLETYKEDRSRALNNGNMESAGYWQEAIERVRKAKDSFRKLVNANVS